METQDIITLVGSLGFPIVACIYLFKVFRAEISELRKAIENNTKVMTRICAKLDIDDEEKKNESE